MNGIPKPGPVIRYLLIASVLFLSACVFNNSNEGLPSDNLTINGIEIDPAHQTCLLPTDCVLVYLDCSGCDCGVPVNSMYEKLYLNLAIETCSEYAGPVCEIYCPPTTLVCQSGLCGTEPLE